jgi:hypothetical protein
MRALALALAATVSTAAMAQSDTSLNIACLTVACVYDGYGQKMGEDIGVSNFLKMYIKGNWYKLIYDDQGFDPSAVFYYTDTNCKSAPYFPFVGYQDNNKVIHLFPTPEAFFDGRSIWGPTGPGVEITYQSYRYPTTSSYCWQQYPPLSGPVTAQVATLLRTPQFFPPFKPQ